MYKQFTGDLHENKPSNKYRTSMASCRSSRTSRICDNANRCFGTIYFIHARQDRIIEAEADYGIKRAYARRRKTLWDKARGVGFQIAKFRPMMRTEDVVVFVNGTGALRTYNPQMVERDKVKKSKCYSSSDSSPLAHNDGQERSYTHKYPTNVIEVSNASQKGKFHPTQKPVALMEYLIHTYTNEGDTVLDNCMGSGTTGVACKNLNRKFIGIEKDETYFKLAQGRIGVI